VRHPFSLAIVLPVPKLTSAAIVTVTLTVAFAGGASTTIAVSSVTVA
jgi:hypothetical protein